MESINWIKLGISCAVFISSGVAAVWRVSWMLSKVIADTKSEFHAMLELEQERRAKDIARAYERFDEYKNHVEDNLLNTCVKKDVCALMHNNTATAVAELKIAIASLDKKLDDLKTTVLSRG